MKKLIVLAAVAACVWHLRGSLFAAPELSPAVEAYAKLNETLAAGGLASFEEARGLCEPMSPCVAAVERLKREQKGYNGLPFKTETTEREIDRERIGFGVDLVTIESTTESFHDPLMGQSIHESRYDVEVEDCGPGDDSVRVELGQRRRMQSDLGPVFRLSHQAELTWSGERWRVRSFIISRR